MYLIFKHESKYQSGTSFAFIASIISSVSPLPLRTDSIVLKAIDGSSPAYIRYTIISSRQPITLDKSQMPERINSCALPSHTSVPCDKPEICTSSENVVGLVSSNIWRTKPVPNSGTPNVPVLHKISSSVTPKEAGLLNICIVSLSSTGIVLGSIPDKSCNIRIIVGSSCPSISSFNTLSWIEWKSKCVVIQDALWSSAGYCIGVKS